MAEPTITYFRMPPVVRAPLAVNCVAMFLVVIVVTLRITARIRGVGIGWDDGLILLATVRLAFSRRNPVLPGRFTESP